ncbi:hypothetical protein BDV96DRAFT_495251 [Lophiotrema nucula]|uniref:SRR1-like domain-containing protein n=1 Tax=Lophiotrema nucula TaxID=690887 RepID=A0A6A5Z4A6_9PLEO|nr:hypothetical protein BDV96DRAFT_495251 [Lophiotrema nucula]
MPKGKGRRVKRKNVAASDGWTVVTHSDSNSSATNGASSSLEDARPKRTVDGLTVDRLLEDLGKLQSRWEETPCARQLTDILGKREWKVEQAVCIGIGSFSLDWEHRHRSMWQLVLFLAVVKLVTISKPQLKLFAQEPAFTPLDIDLLSAVSINVLTTNIESHITSKSFVFAPFVDWNLLLPIFLKDKDPDLYIGNEILDDYGPYARTEEKERRRKECEAIAQGFLKGRQSMKVPEFSLHAHALNGLVSSHKVQKSTGEQE